MGPSAAEFSPATAGFKLTTAELRQGSGRHAAPHGGGGGGVGVGVGLGVGLGWAVQVFV